ncbi:MAG: YbhB/YbcL family Raf kinase inhibitor-like protein [Candidatus Acidiferrales bacterium]
MKFLRSVTLLSVGIITMACAQRPATPLVMAMALSSSSFEDGGIIPPKFTRSAETPVSPSLAWTGVPQNTMTFALILHDPEVPVKNTAEDVVHWLIFNIPGATTHLSEGVPVGAKLPDGSIQGTTLAGTLGYMAPGARADGPYHHYIFELYALDTKLDLGPEAHRADLFKAMEGHVLAKGVLTGRYHRLQ